MYYYRRIKDLREDHDMKQEQVAKHLGIIQQQYSRYETGAREIPVHLLIQLAELYGVSLDYIAGRTNEQSNPNL